MVPLILKIMILRNPKNGKLPRISPKAFIAPNATIIGEVIIESGANIWPNTVLRGDYGLIHIGKNCSVQDNSMVHADIDKPVILQDNVLVGHNVVVHGACLIEEYSMIGIHSTVLDGTKIGRGSILGSGAVTNKEFEPLSLILGIPGKLKKTMSEEGIAQTKEFLGLYVENSEAYIKAGYNHPDIEKYLDPTI